MITPSTSSIRTFASPSPSITVSASGSSSPLGRLTVMQPSASSAGSHASARRKRERRACHASQILRAPGCTASASARRRDAASAGAGLALRPRAPAPLTPSFETHESSRAIAAAAQLQPLVPPQFGHL